MNSSGSPLLFIRLQLKLRQRNLSYMPSYVKALWILPLEHGSTFELLNPSSPTVGLEPPTTGIDGQHCYTVSYLLTLEERLLANVSFCFGPLNFKMGHCPL